MSRGARSAFWILRAVLLALVLAHTDAGDPRLDSRTPRNRPHAASRVLVRFRDEASAGLIAQSIGKRRLGFLRKFARAGNVHLLSLPGDLSVDQALNSLSEDPDVLYAEPDFIVRVDAIPDDPLFPSLWGLSPQSQSGGTSVHGIDAPRAWDLTTGDSSVVIGVIDTGLDYSHPDLAANVWTNPLDCDADGHDDDRNGYVDDCHGIDVVNGDSDPRDDNGHGTHVSGTIAAVGDNGVGVVGVAWRASLAACKFADHQGNGSVSGAVACLEYFALMRERGLAIVATNNSWGGSGYSQALHDAVEAHRRLGILFIASAGNESDDLDAYPRFPAALDLPNVVTVAATGHLDGMASFSNEGRHSVHLGAPGVDIVSTWPGGGYESFSGTSMAAPHVSGAAALIKAADPSRDWRTVRNLLLAGGDNRQGLSGTVTRRRLDALGSLTCVNNVVASRLAPAGRALAAHVGVPLPIRVLHIDCSEPAGDVEVLVDPGSERIQLRDDGESGDQVAGDGIYSALWTPDAEGRYELTFPGSEIVPLRVFAPGDPALSLIVSDITGFYGAFPEAVAIGDLNGDGLNDAVMTTGTGFDINRNHNLYVFHQNLSGELDPFVRYPAADPGSNSYVKSVALGDLNGDGRTDAAVATYVAPAPSRSFVGVFLQAPDGTLEPMVRYPVPDVRRVAIGDLDGDGRADLIAATPSGYRVNIFRLMQDSSGSLQQAGPMFVEFADPVVSVELAVVDLRGDGLGDILVLPVGDHRYLSDYRRLAVLRQSAGGVFVPPVMYGTREMTVSPDGLGVGDVDGDGRADVVITQAGSLGGVNPYMSVLMQDAAGGLTRTAVYPAFRIPSAATIADLDGDGLNDVVTAQHGWDSLGVFMGAGRGSLFPYELHHLYDTQHWNAQALASGDLNNDGLADLLFASVTGYVRVLYSQSPFRPWPSRLFVHKQGKGQGVVVSEPAGISCGQGCEASFAYGTRVTLRATPAPGSRFEEWSGCFPAADGSCASLLRANGDVFATFVLEKARVTASTSGTGHGTVTSEPAGIDCGKDCEEDFDLLVDYRYVKFTARADPHSELETWLGACVGVREPTCTLRLSENAQVGARFRRVRAKLTVTLSGEGSGVVTSAPPGITCPPDCEEVYSTTTNVTLSAQADAASAFRRWSGACAGAAPCSIRMDQIRTLGAYFVQPPLPQAPPEGAVFSVEEGPPVFEWLPGEFDRFRIVLSWRPDLKGQPMAASGEGFTLRGTSWAMPAAIWEKVKSRIAPRGGGTVHYAISGRDSTGSSIRSAIRTLRVE